MDWNDVRHFLALARLGSIRAAGASLGVSHSTVARRVEALEATLNARLFDRTRDGYTLTAAGQQMVPGAARIEIEMAALERGLVGRDERLSGPVAVTCCDAFVAALIIDALTEMCTQYPGIELGITTDSRAFDLSKREADIAVRILARNAQPPAHLIGARVVPVIVANYVARVHRAQRDPDHPGSAPRWVSFDDRKQQEAMIATTHYAHVPAWGAFSSLEALIQAARAGLGIVMLPTYVGDQQTDLCRLAHPDLHHVADIWLLSHPDLRENARFRAVRKRTSAALKAHAGLFEGRRPIPAPDGPEIAPGDAPSAGVR